MISNEGIACVKLVGESTIKANHTPTGWAEIVNLGLAARRPRGVGLLTNRGLDFLNEISHDPLNKKTGKACLHKSEFPLFTAGRKYYCTDCHTLRNDKDDSRYSLDNFTDAPDELLTEILNCIEVNWDNTRPIDPLNYRKDHDDTTGQLITDRARNYGDFTIGAEIMQCLKTVMHGAPNWDEMPTYMCEALDMVQHKIGRILNGDPRYLDSWDDIMGYVRLVVEQLEKEGVKR